MFSIVIDSSVCNSIGLSIIFKCMFKTASFYSINTHKTIKHNSDDKHRTRITLTKLTMIM